MLEARPPPTEAVQRARRLPPHRLVSCTARAGGRRWKEKRTMKRKAEERILERISNGAATLLSNNNNNKQKRGTRRSCTLKCITMCSLLLLQCSPAHLTQLPSATTLLFLFSIILSADMCRVDDYSAYQPSRSRSPQKLVKEWLGSNTEASSFTPATIARWYTITCT